MRILLITSVWTGSVPIFFQGQPEPVGMPAFSKLLEKLANNPNVDLSLILLCNSTQYAKQLNVSPWLKDVNIIKFHWSNESLIRSFYKLYITTNQLIAKTLPNIVYLHGTLGLPSYFAARINRVAIGQRIYGTFFYDRIIKKGKLRTLVQSPFEYASFKLKKDFLLVTDDGTKGDKVADIINGFKLPYDLYFLENGVDTNFKNVFNLEHDEKFIFYPARITKWKRQDLAIDLLSKLKDKTVKLFFAGKIADKDYYNTLITMINKLNLQDRVVFLGELSHKETCNIMSKSLAVAAFYDTSCKGNVALEAIASECVFITLKDRGLEQLIENNVSGIVGTSINECAVQLDKLVLNPELLDKIKLNLKSNPISSWDERLDLEYDILTKYSQ